MNRKTVMTIARAAGLAALPLAVATAFAQQPQAPEMTKEEKPIHLPSDVLQF